MGYCLVCGSKLRFIQSVQMPGGKLVCKEYQCQDKSCELTMIATYDPKKLTKGSTITVTIAE